MTAILRQSAGAGIGSGAQTATARLPASTVPGSLLVVMAAATHPGSGGTTLTGPPGFTLVRQGTRNELTAAFWYRHNAPPTTSLAVSSTAKRSLQIRAMELTGVAQANSLDQVSMQFGSSDAPDTGLTAAQSQPDELVLGVIANRYANVTQSAFTGGMGKLYETTSPTIFAFPGSIIPGLGGIFDLASSLSGDDANRTRMSVHGANASFADPRGLTARLSAARDWVAIIATFRHGSTGPARFTSVAAPPVVVVGGTGSLTAFGPLTSVQAPPVVAVGGSGWVAPFNHQYLLGGRAGLLIGDSTRFRVEAIAGLEGWEIRTSDDDLPRGDGALRGVDLQSARQVLFRLHVTGTQTEVEADMDTLYRALVPQRDRDWDLIWRHPGRPPRLLRCRPTNLVREMDGFVSTILGRQAFALRAVDPRHYGVVTRQVTVPVAPVTGAVPTVSAVNLGNTRAHPLITIAGAPNVEVSRVELINTSAYATFDVATILPPGAVLVGDMPAGVTAAPRPVITVDGQSKYGAWQFPREPFHLGAAPESVGGVNQLFVRTTPPGAAVTCTVQWADTWAG